MGWFTRLFCPTDADIVEAIEELEEGIREGIEEDEEGKECADDLRDWIERHGWHQEKRFGHTVWNKDE